MKLRPFFQKSWRTGRVVLARYFRRRPRYLPTLVIFVTNRCNLRCRMCGVWDLYCAGGHEAELTTEEWKAVIASAAKELGTFLLTISGGEPMLRPDIFELIQFARKLGVSVHLCSNATLLTEAKILQLKEAGLVSISISLESTEEILHNHLQGKDTFADVVRSIQLLRTLAPEIRVGINFLITRKNYEKMIPMVHFARDLGVHQIKFLPIHSNLQHRHKARTEFEDLFFEKEDLPALAQEVEAVRKECRQSGLRSSSDAFFKGIVDYYTTPRKVKCYAGYSVGTVDPLGNVAPCCDKNSTLNVRQQSLASIWWSPEFHRMRDLVFHCNVPCWDTTFTEMSLILQPRTLFGNFLNLLKDMRFYFPDN